MKVTCYCRAAEVMQIESTLAITNIHEAQNSICSRKNPCGMYFSGQMSVYLLMKECEHWLGFDHKIYFVGYDYIGNRKKYYWLCRRASNCPFPNAQGCSSGRKQSVWPLLALSSFILHNAGSASRLLSKSFTAVSTLLVRVTWLWSNHDGRIMFQKPGSIHCTEIGCKCFPCGRTQHVRCMHFSIVSMIQSVLEFRFICVIPRSRLNGR